MKNPLFAILLCILPCISNAQKNNLFADIGTSNFSHVDFSATYSRKLVKNFGIGLGAQTVYATAAAPVNYPYDRPMLFKPSVYADLRAYFKIKKSLLFLFIDPGLSIYQDKGIPGLMSAHSNGFYVGYGLGYSYPLTPRGGGPYCSLKIASDGYTITEYNPYSGEQNRTTYFDGIAVFALGFKF